MLVGVIMDDLFSFYLPVFSHFSTIPCILLIYDFKKEIIYTIFKKETFFKLKEKSLLIRRVPYSDKLK